MTPPSVSSSFLKNINYKSCDVSGCDVNTLSARNASFFPVTDDPARRTMWLNSIGRSDLNDADGEIYICDRHFYDHDIITTPRRPFLRRAARPARHLPDARAAAAAAQTAPDNRDAHTQTDYKHTVSHMVCQKGSSFVVEMRHKRNIKEEYEAVTNLLKMHEAMNSHHEMFRSACDEILSSRLSEVVKAIIDNLEGKTHSIAYKIFCLKLHYISPQAYRLISEDFQLPPISKLKEISLPISTNAKEYISTAFQTKVQSMTETQKYCSVVVDVIRLKESLFYSAKYDKIIGFHEIDGLQTPLPARHAVVLAAKSIFTNWTQPIGFALLSDTKCRQTREEVSNWITNRLTELINIGLKVKTFACTAKTKLLNEANLRQVSIDKPYFLINGEKIYYIYDFPHMFRMLRNHFLTHDFVDKNHVAKFEHVKDFYVLDKTRELKIAHNLTDSHINPSAAERRDTRYASELLSGAVAAGIDTYADFDALHSSAKDTAEFLAMMHKLNEVMNSTVPAPQTSRGNATQNFLTKVLDFFRSLQLINKTTCEAVDPSTLLFAKGMQVTIKSVMLLLQDLQQNSYNHLPAANLNLGVTEEMFMKIKSKGDKSVEPTSQRFMLKFGRLFFAHFVKRRNTGGLTDDLLKTIATLNELSEKEKLKSTDGFNIDSSADEASFPDESGTSTNTVSDKTGLPNVIGATELKAMAKLGASLDCHRRILMLLQKCLEYHHCETFKHFVTTYQIDHNLSEPSKGTIVPNYELFDYFARMENKTQAVFDNSRTSRSLVATIYESFKFDPVLNTYTPCPCFPVNFFQIMFIRVTIYMLLDYNNAALRTKSNSDKVFNFVELFTSSN